MPGSPLIAHLRGNLGFLGGKPQMTRFVHVMSQRLLGVHMLAQLDRLHRRHRMRMVGRGDGYRVDFLVHLIEHLAEIGVLLGLGMAHRLGLKALLVNVANRHKIGVLGGLFAVAVPFSADAYARHVDLFIGRLFLNASHPVAARNPDAHAGDQRRGLDKLTTVHARQRGLRGRADGAIFCHSSLHVISSSCG